MSALLRRRPLVGAEIHLAARVVPESPREGGNGIMLALLAEKIPELERLCKLYGVRQLEVAGSAAREEDFDPTQSDIDLLVEFEPGRLPALSELFRLRDAIEKTVGRPAGRRGCRFKAASRRRPPGSCSRAD